jgi:hypothetical protein
MPHSGPVIDWFTLPPCCFALSAPPLMFARFWSSWLLRNQIGEWNIGELPRPVTVIEFDGAMTSASAQAPELIPTYGSTIMAALFVFTPETEFLRKTEGTIDASALYRTPSPVLFNISGPGARFPLTALHGVSAEVSIARITTDLHAAYAKVGTKARRGR